MWHKIELENQTVLNTFDYVRSVLASKLNIKYKYEYRPLAHTNDALQQRVAANSRPVCTDLYGSIGIVM